MVKELSPQDKAFATRVERWKDHKRINNASLYAGSPMYYYCRLCGAEMVLPEAHICMAPRYCTDCVGEGRGSNTAT